MKKKKIKVLVIPSDRTGVSYFRSTKPHIKLEEMFPEEFHVDIEYEPKLDNDEWLKNYDIIHYHRNLGSYEEHDKLVKKCEELGILTFLDIDDYWSVGPNHPAFEIIKHYEMDKKIHNNLKSASNIITTTSLFANEIKKVNKNVFILPNAIDPTEKQYVPNPEPSERIRIGWLGGSSHEKDLEILKGVVAKLTSDGLIDKVQFVLCGFDLRGEKIDTDKNGNQFKRPLKPMESVWYRYEKIFTNDYKSVSPEYKNFLHKFKEEEYPNVANEPYRRVWTKPISTYAMNYNLFDISLAPIEPTIFNMVKSQLKVIEAGFHKKAIIAQNYGPYKIDIKHAYVKATTKGGDSSFDETANGFLVEPFNNHKDWYRFIKRLIKNPNEITTLQKNLHETVKDTYSIETVTNSRRELYIDTLNKFRGK